MLTTQFVIQNLVHVSALFTLICYLFRDQIKLRLFAMIGDALLAIYYFAGLDQPLWNPLGWSIVNILVNVFMIALLYRDGRIFQMSDREMSLFRKLDSLTPGQFRTLMKDAEWSDSEAQAILTQEGEKPDKLHFVLEGAITIDKAGRSFDVEPGHFIGELAYLRKKPATATARVSSGARVVSWTHEALQKLTTRDPALAAALGLLLNNDLAEKVARG
jgi:hypothetical protein